MAARPSTDRSRSDLEISKTRHMPPWKRREAASREPCLVPALTRVAAARRHFDGGPVIEAEPRRQRARRRTLHTSDALAFYLDSADYEPPVDGLL